MKSFNFNSEELSVFKKLNSPAKIQDFIDYALKYNLEENGETFYSPRFVLKHMKAHCFEGAVFAATALAVQGFTPLLLDLRAVRDDDHVVALFKGKNGWGAIAQSKYSGLRYREPIYPNLKALTLSYFEHYYNWQAEKDLREFSVPFNLLKFGIDWMTTEKSIDFLAEKLDEAKHYNILLKGTARTLRKVQSFNFKNEVIIKPKEEKYKKLLE